jgi:hypothetical protein
MKSILTILCILAIASVALADKPLQPVDNPIDRVECAFENIAYDWLFADSDHGFTTGACDDGGVPVWEYGETVWWPDNVWATGLTTPDEEYPNDSGESLISPGFMVDDSAYLVEIRHAYNIENSYDGGNLSVNGVVVAPMEGYPDDEISDSTGFYAWCVDGEPGFTDVNGPEPFSSCFDLSAFMGEEVQLSFDFGSDSSVQRIGWYIGHILVGGDVVANEGATWSHIKGLYR